MAFAIKARLEGVEQSLKNLQEMTRTVRNKILRKAVNASSKVVLDAARQLVPSSTGLLKKSLAVRVQTYRASGVVVGIVGPRTGYQKTRQGKKITSFGKKMKAAGQNPSKYAHLIEFGHNLARPKGNLIGYVRARPFLRPAFDQNKSSVIALMEQRITEEIEKEAKKLGGKK